VAAHTPRNRFKGVRVSRSVKDRAKRGPYSERPKGASIHEGVNCTLMHLEGPKKEQ